MMGGLAAAAEIGLRAAQRLEFLSIARPSVQPLAVPPTSSGRSRLISDVSLSALTTALSAPSSMISPSCRCVTR